LHALRARHTISDMVPEHLWRHPTRTAIDSLALRFGLPNTLYMQDWEIEVADASRLDEFITAYRSGDLDEDERFTLMETILASLDELGDAAAIDPRWETVRDLLESNVALHAYSIWYWASSEADEPDEQWHITPLVRPLLERHRAALMAPG